jgi:hypothetical protein
MRRPNPYLLSRRAVYAAREERHMPTGYEVDAMRGIADIAKSMLVIKECLMDIRDHLVTPSTDLAMMDRRLNERIAALEERIDIALTKENGTNER